MQLMQLAGVDLNLLPALVVLLEERSVSHAANAVGLSPSAMSRSLGRLRRLLEDELLVRSAAGYQLTPAAEQLKVELAEVLPHLQSMFLDRKFDPAAETRQFRMAGSDYAVATLGSLMFSTLLAAAPHSSLRFFPWHSGAVQHLTDGELDLVFSGMQMAPPVMSEQLFTDEIVCVVARGHPLSQQKSITLEDYLSYGHLVIDIDRGVQPVIDGVLSARGTPRKAALTLPFHSLAPAALLDTQLILSIPSRALGWFVAPQGEELCVFSAPVHIKTLPYYMSWHTRLNHDKGHRWLREQVRHALQTPNEIPDD